MPWMGLNSRRSWLLLAVTVLAVVVAALVLKSALPGGGVSPLATPASAAESPLPGPDGLPQDPGTPGLTDESPSLWPGAAAALLWVALGIILALGLSALVRRLLRPSG